MVYIVIVAIIVLSETMIKNYMEKNMRLDDKKEVLNGNVILRKSYNCGMFMNFMENKKEMVKYISTILVGSLLLLFICILPKKGNKIFKLGLSFALGGAISNVMDRLLRGYVVDYFSLRLKKIQNVVFNLADMFIFLGAIMIGIASLFSLESERSTDKSFE